MTFELRVNTENHTTKVFRVADLIAGYGSKEGFLSELKPKLEAELISQVSAKFAEKGYNVSVGNFFFGSQWIDSSRWFVDRYIQVTELRLKVDYSVYSDQQISSSPLAAWVMPLVALILKWAVIAILGFFAILAIKEVVESMVTDTTKIWEYDEEGNLISYSEKREPSLGGMSILFIAIIVILVIGLMFMGRGIKEG